MTADCRIRVWVIGSEHSGRRVLTTAMLNTLRTRAAYWEGNRFHVRMLREEDERLLGEHKVIADMQGAGRRNLTVLSLFRGEEVPPAEELDTLELVNFVTRKDSPDLHCGRMRLLNICGLGNTEEKQASAAVLLVLDGARIAESRTDDEETLCGQLSTMLRTRDLAVVPVITKRDLLSEQDQADPAAAAGRVYPKLTAMIAERIPKNIGMRCVSVTTDRYRVFDVDGNLLENPGLMPEKVLDLFLAVYFALLSTAAPITVKRMQARMRLLEQETARSIGLFRQRSVRAALSLNDTRIRYAQAAAGIGPLLTLCGFLAPAEPSAPKPSNQTGVLP